MPRNNRNIIAIILVLAVLLPLVLLGGYYIIFIGRKPPTSKINTPLNNANVLLDGPILVQSIHSSGDTARVELRVRPEGEQTETVIWTPAPEDGVVLQQWTANQLGKHTVTVTAFDFQNKEISRAEILVTVVAQIAIDPRIFDPPTATPTPTATLPVPTPTPTLTPGVTVEVVTPAAVAVSPTPVLIFPPPPPAPGVPHGPLQKQLPELMPPVCDAAKYLGPFVPTTRQRITITEPDQVPAKTAGGSLVHRIWEMQNIGTCTWGTGYELAFYGGRTMGSGGVAFEAFYPTDVEPRNEVAVQGRLIVPEGKPNQIARLEVLLLSPVTPGIHQSYWRMRNPQGVYFGPIVGVTLDVVRECDFGIYGAPVVNKFEILGVGDVFQPENRTRAIAEFGNQVTLEWSIINAQSYAIIITDPVGNTTNLATNSLTDRGTFIVNQLGEWTITLIAENGNCTARAGPIIITVIPREGEQFDLIITSSSPAATAAGTESALRFSSAISPTSIGAEWRHFDDGVNNVFLFSSVYGRTLEPECSVVIAGNAVLCAEPAWKPLHTIQQRLGDNEGAAIVSNVKAVLSRFITDPKVEYQFRYVAQANKDGNLDQLAPCSNTVVEPLPRLQFPTEISPDQAGASSQAQQATATSPCIADETAEAAAASQFVLFPAPDEVEGGCVLTIGDLCLNWPEIILGGLAILIFIWIIRAILR